MRYVTTGKQMKEIDRYTMEEIGIPSMVLMERAAWAFVEEIRGALKKTDRIWVCLLYTSWSPGRESPPPPF